MLALINVKRLILLRRLQHPVFEIFDLLVCLFLKFNHLIITLFHCLIKKGLNLVELLCLVLLLNGSLVLELSDVGLEFLLKRLNFSLDFSANRATRCDIAALSNEICGNITSQSRTH